MESTPVDAFSAQLSRQLNAIHAAAVGLYVITHLDSAPGPELHPLKDALTQMGKDLGAFMAEELYSRPESPIPEEIPV
jgi:hypothetical protein